MSRLSEADVEKSCKPKDAATEGFCFQQTMIRVKVGIGRIFRRFALMQSLGQLEHIAYVTKLIQHRISSMRSTRPNLG